MNVNGVPTPDEIKKYAIFLPYGETDGLLDFYRF